MSALGQKQTGAVQNLAKGQKRTSLALRLNEPTDFVG